MGRHPVLFSASLIFLPATGLAPPRRARRSPGRVARGRIVGLLGAVLLSSAATLRAEPVPSAFFVQTGLAQSGHTGSASAGLTWDWQRSWSLGSGRVAGYWEASAAGWSYRAEAPHGRRELLQFALTPVLRYRGSDGTSRWFAEAGIGATWMTRHYQTDDKQFSTRWNFGDHLALGWFVGADQRDEIALRIQHFSNGGFKEPNSGENFVQLRYVHRLR